MAILTSDDEAYLLRRLGRNDCVLFLGAGFPRDATNRRLPATVHPQGDAEGPCRGRPRDPRRASGLPARAPQARPELPAFDARQAAAALPMPTPRRIGYSVVPEADVRLEPGAEAWNGELQETGEAWLFADSLIRHQLRADPGDLWMIAVDGDSMEPLLSSGRPHPDRREPDGARAAGDLRDLGRHGARRKADRARAALRPAPRGPQTGQPRIRQLRAARRGDPRRRTGRLGLETARRGWRASRGRSARAGGRYIASSTPDAERVAMKILPVGHRQSDSSSERSMSWERRQ